MTTTREVYLGFGLMEISNKVLKTGRWSTIWR